MYLPLPGQESQDARSLTLQRSEGKRTKYIDPIHKWLPIKNYFVSIKISQTNLVLSLKFKRIFTLRRG